MSDEGESQALEAWLPQETSGLGFGPLADEVAFPRLTEAELADAARPKEWRLPSATAQRP